MLHSTPSRGRMGLAQPREAPHSLAAAVARVSSCSPCLSCHGPQPAAASSTSSSSRVVQEAAAIDSLELVTPPPLKPVPIIHTTAYLQQTQQLVVPQMSLEEDSQQQQLQQQLQQRDNSGNAIVWALKKVDDQLDLVEQQPSEIHQALYNFSNGPVGQATSKGVQAAAKLTMTATIEAAKAAAPVGKWALQQGFKAAVSLVSVAMEQERQQKQQQKNQSKGKGSKSKGNK